MHFSLVNPYIRVAMESQLSGKHHISRRIIYDYEVIYLEKGEFTLVYDGAPYHCSAGDVIFIRPGIAHSFQLDHGDISQPHIHFDITYRPQSEKIPVSFKEYEQMTDTERGWIHPDYFSSYFPTPLLTLQSRNLFLECFYRIIRKKDDNALVKKALMIQLISMLMENHFQDIIKEQRVFRVEQQVKDYMDAGNGLGMTLDDFSNVFFYSKFYLEKKFKQAFGIGLIEYKNKKRMEMANDLLKTHSVSEVSELLFYGSIYSFSRAYKNHFGYAPTNKGRGKAL